MKTIQLKFLFVVVMLAGCSAPTRTPYYMPTVPLPDAFDNVVTDTGATHLDTWWRMFDEPGLNAWVDLALARNTDLAAAAIRVKRATFEARLAGMMRCCQS